MDLQDALGSTIQAIDGLVLVHPKIGRGLPPSRLRVFPPNACGRDSVYADLPALESPFSEAASRHLPVAKEKHPGKSRNKVFLAGYESYVHDHGALVLHPGRTDYLRTRALEEAFDNGEFTEAYVNGELEILTDLPGLVAVVGAIVTSDEHLILAQRRDSEGWGSLCYSMSFEEGWEPGLDAEPVDVVRRGLSEEFHLDEDHGVVIDDSRIQLLGIGREWGEFWNTVLAYIVHVPCDAGFVLRSWGGMLDGPVDHREHKGLAAVSLRRNWHQLLELADRGSTVTESWLARVNASRAGHLSRGEIHPTHGRARLLWALNAFPPLGRS